VRLAMGVFEQWCPMTLQPRRILRLARKTGGQADKQAAKKVSFDWTDSRNDIGPHYLGEEMVFRLPYIRVLQTAGEVRSAEVKRSAATWTPRAR
jgi:hypothetical protein